MTSLVQRAKTDWRIIWAIVAKDVVEAIRNKTTLTIAITALAMVFFYRYLPVFEAKNEPLRVYAYNPGGSTIVRDLEESPNVRLREVPSRDVLIELTREAGISEAFVEFPTDFDQARQEGGAEVTVYRVHWIDDKAFDEDKVRLEDELTALAGVPVTAVVYPELIYVDKETAGPPFFAAFGMVYVIIMTGMIMIPHLMFEEKQTQTMEALLVSPARPYHIVIGKALTGLFYCLLGFLIAVIVNWAMVSHIWLTLVMGILGSLLSVAIGLLLGTLLDNRQQLTMVAWIILLPLLLPLFFSMMDDLMPPLVISIIDWVPTAALSAGFRASFARSLHLADFGRELLLLAGVTVILLLGEGLILRRSDRRA